MNSVMIEHLNKFQHSDFDDDIVGICFALTNWMGVIVKEVGSENLPEPADPAGFHKLHPHLPAMDTRQNFRKFLALATKNQNDKFDNVIKYSNIFVTLQAGSYVYHMPAKKMHDMALHGNYTRKDIESTLLDDGMSPNWLKEPTDKDFTALYL